MKVEERDGGTAMAIATATAAEAESGIQATDRRTAATETEATEETEETEERETIAAMTATETVTTTKDGIAAGAAAGAQDPGRTAHTTDQMGVTGLSVAVEATMSEVADAIAGMTAMLLQVVPVSTSQRGQVTTAGGGHGSAAAALSLDATIPTLI